MKRIYLAIATILFMSCNTQELPAAPSVLPPSVEDTSQPEKMPSDFGTTVNPKAFTQHAIEDYGVEANTLEDQTPVLQTAIESLSARGGGNLIIPEGTYHIAELYMCSNVHLRLSKHTILKPHYTNKTGNVIMIHFTPKGTESKDKYLQNCSVTCYDGGKYTVDYSHLASDGSSTLHKCRFILNRRVRDFLIADAHILDNYTKYCGIIFVGASSKDKLGIWPIVRPTSGVIRNCQITNASHGYGLCQLHAGDSLFYNNIRAKGGVTLRLEGHTGENVGTHHIFGQTIYNEQGKTAVMFQPHVTHHGKVIIEDVESNGSACAILIRDGFIDRQAQGDPNAEKGSFATGSKVNNIRATYGLQSQIEAKDAWIYEPDQYFSIKKINLGDGHPSFEGASYGPVIDDTRQNYVITCTNIQATGFPHKFQKEIIFTENLPRSQKDTWKISATIPTFNEDMIRKRKAKTR